MFRWNGPLADLVETELDLIRDLGTGLAGPVQRDALFPASSFEVGGVVRAAARAHVVLTPGSPLVYFYTAPAAVRAGARAAGGLDRVLVVPGAARAAARALGTLTDPTAGTITAIFPAPPDDPAAILSATVALGPFVDEVPAPDPTAWLRGASAPNARAVARDRTPLGRVVARPEGAAMLYRKQYDTSGDVILELARVLDGHATAAPELADATLVQLRRRSPSGVVSRVTMTVLDAARGLVSAPVGAALAEAGPHALTVEVTNPGGITTYPHQGTLTLLVEPVVG